MSSHDEHRTSEDGAAPECGSSSNPGPPSFGSARIANQLIETLMRELIMFATTLTRDRVLARDLVGDLVAAQLHKSMSDESAYGWKFFLQAAADPEGKAFPQHRAYLHACLRNAWTSRGRLHAHRRTQPFAEDELERIEDGKSAEEMLAAREELAIGRALLREHAHEYEEGLRKDRSKNLSPEEIAKVVGEYVAELPNALIDEEAMARLSKKQRERAQRFREEIRKAVRGHPMVVAAFDRAGIKPTSPTSKRLHAVAVGTTLVIAVVVASVAYWAQPRAARSRLSATATSNSALVPSPNATVPRASAASLPDSSPVIGLTSPAGRGSSSPEDPRDAARRRATLVREGFRRRLGAELIDDRFMAFTPPQPALGGYQQYGSLNMSGAWAYWIPGPGIRLVTSSDTEAEGYTPVSPVPGDESGPFPTVLTFMNRARIRFLAITPMALAQHDCSKYVECVGFESGSAMVLGCWRLDPCHEDWRDFESESVRPPETILVGTPMRVEPWRFGQESYVGVSWTGSPLREPWGLWAGVDSRRRGPPGEAETVRTAQGARRREIIAHLLEGGDGRPSPEVFGLFAGLARAACASRYDSICQWIEALPSEE